MIRPEKVGKALKLVLERLRETEKEESDYKEPKHICTYCKHRNMEEGYDQQWGRLLVIRNWCGKDQNLMNTCFSYGNDKHFSEPCEYFEFGEGVYHEMSETVKRELGIG